ncbi:MAG TPA: flagellin [Tepidisphaeraceae bacterium]|jgi:flagellin
MSRINTNISSLQAIHTLTRNQTDLNTRLQRLSTGLKINSGKDAPAGLIASETLRSEINGIHQAIDNSTRAGNVINTGEGALSEVSALLLEVQSLTNEAANTGALSPEEIKANQLQVDAILNSVNRISNTTQFNGVKLLNGELDYSTSGVLSTAIDSLQINAAKLPDNGTTTVVVQVVASAQLAEVDTTVSGVGAAPVTIQIAGNAGVEQLSFAASTHNSAIVVAINQLKAATGVSATLSGAALRVTSTAYGSSQFVTVKSITGTFLDATDKGQDAQVNVNGTTAEVDGLSASVRTENLDVHLDLDATFGTTIDPNGTTFVITGGGAKFQLGSQVNRQGQINVGIGSVSSSNLGNGVVGYLSSLASGGANSLISGNTIQAQKIITAAIRQVADLRGRLGALQKDVLETNVNSLNVALENVTASESAIRDADFASETAALTRSQILVQANTSVLAQANSSPQQVLSLLGR